MPKNPTKCASFHHWKSPLEIGGTGIQFEAKSDHLWLKRSSLQFLGDASNPSWFLLLLGDSSSSLTGCGCEGGRPTFLYCRLLPPPCTVSVGWWILGRRCRCHRCPCLHLRWLCLWKDNVENEANVRDWAKNNFYPAITYLVQVFVFLSRSWWIPTPCSSYKVLQWLLAWFFFCFVWYKFAEMSDCTGKEATRVQIVGVDLPFFIQFCGMFILHVAPRWHGAMWFGVLCVVVVDVEKEYGGVHLNTSMWVVNGRTNVEQYWCGHVNNVA